MPEGIVYTTQDGNIPVSYFKVGVHDSEEPRQTTGWRERSDGTREEVIYYGGEFGWMTLDERSDARQKYPRTAP